MSNNPQLPNEVIEGILLRLPVLAHSKESVRTLCNVALANYRFLTIARLSHIWQPHYAARWKRCDSAREQSRRSTAQDWWRLYSTRAWMDHKALVLFDAIVAQPDVRKSAAVDIVKDLGYDVWDVISEEIARVRYRKFTDQDSFDVPVEGLTRQYWGREVLGVISRFRAVSTWLRLRSYREETDSFEQGLASLSAFFGEDVERIYEEFDRLAGHCRLHLSSLGLFASSDTTETIIQICAWMRQQGFVKTDITNYHHLMNHFPHRVLFEQPSTLPISLVYVFVSIAKRLGLNARPVAFPHHILAVVFPLVGDAIYIDVFESATRPILSYTSDLPLMLRQMGISPLSLARFTPPASTPTMLFRAAGNIIYSLERSMLWRESDQMAAHYAAYCAALILSGDPEVVQTLFVLGVGGPLDSEVILKNALCRGLPAVAKEELERHLARDAEKDRIEPGSVSREGVRYFAGMLFRHRVYDYVGLIRGWDSCCEAGDDWIQRMRVNDLSQGGNQPFYHSFTSDGHMRYVAEENINPLPRPKPSDIDILIKVNKELGRWFDGVEFTASGVARFRLSADGGTPHPDDEEAGRVFLAEQSHQAIGCCS